MKQQLEYIDLDNLSLDENNPRLPSYLIGANEKDIIEYMLLEASTIELMQAIGENDFFPGEQLLVTKISDTEYKVVEGNRRLTALKLLQDPTQTDVQSSKVNKVANEAEFKPTSIPCLIFDEDEEIHKYLGYKHITGIQAWNLRQKATYLNTLKDSLLPDKGLEESSKELAKKIGSRRDYVKRLLVGHQIFTIIKEQAFFQIKDLDEKSFYFGYISDSLSRSNIVDFLNVDLNNDNPIEKINLANLEKWTKWLFERYGESGRTRLKGKSSDLNKLNAILGNDEAFKAFDSNDYSLDDAYELTEDIELIFYNSIVKSKNELETAKNYIHKLEKFYSNLDDDLRQIVRLCKIIKTTKDQFTNKDFEDEL